MKKEIAEAWVKDLRKNPRKTKRKLYDGKGGHCCLGRLCRVLGASFKNEYDCGVSAQVPVFKRDVFHYDHQLLPETLRLEAGMKTKSGTIDHKGICLSSMNDDGASFAEIADIIEKNWRDL